MIVVWQSCARSSTCPDCSLTLGAPCHNATQVCFGSHLLPLLPRYAQNTVICSLCPQGTSILPYAHLIGVEVLSTVMRMNDSIALGHSCLLDSSIVPILQGVLIKCRWSHCSDIMARYSRNHAPSWRQTSSVPRIKWL